MQRAKNHSTVGIQSRRISETEKNLATCFENGETVILESCKSSSKTS